MEKILEVNNLHVSFRTDYGKVHAVRGVSFQVHKGETIAIVGESGSGKSVTSKAIMRLIKEPAGKIEAGEILFEGRNLLSLSKREMKKVQGSKISMIFQDPMSSLNPTMTIGAQIGEGLVAHQNYKKSESRKRVIELLELVGISEPHIRYKHYPHQFSGGMRQRAAIAMALACNPKILIADEPTTALDVTVQAQILELLKDIQKKLGTSIIFITHDFGVVANMADRVMVMYAGKIIETGTVDEIFSEPRHPYTYGLLASMPSLHEEAGALFSIPGSPPDLSALPKGDPFAPRNRLALEVDFEMEPPAFQLSETHYASTWLLHPDAPKLDLTGSMGQKQKEKAKNEAVKDKRQSTEKVLELSNVSKIFKIGRGKLLHAVNGISLDVYKGETVGIVGESGSGKSTLGRTIIGLLQADGGSIKFRGKDFQNIKSNDDWQAAKRNMQMIFQDPYSSLNPRLTVSDIIGEGIDIHRLFKSRNERNKEIVELLETVGLSRKHASRYPHEFSGGQRQRIGIARALAVNPSLIIADEPISALDVSIQAQVVNLLKSIQEERELTFLFIAHDLSMVKYISDRIGVMYKGQIVELAKSSELYKNPLHPYTKALLSANPIPDPAVERQRERIVFQEAEYNQERERVFREVGDDHWILCSEKEFENVRKYESITKDMK